MTTKRIFCFVLLFLCLFTPAFATPPTLSLHFLDVGQADCILVQSPNGHSMLIDAGNNEDSRTILSYLNKQGIKKLDIVIGTHPHEDHIGSMDTVIKSFDIGQIYLPKVGVGTKTFKDLLIAIKQKGLKVSTAKAGVKLDFDPILKSEFLAPNNDTYEDLNNYSPVVKLAYGKTAFLLTGDAESVSESEILEKGYNLKADLLKIGHHGSRGSTSETFLKAVSPKIAVISVGIGNRYGHPAPETIKRLIRHNVRIYQTNTDGSIIITSDGRGIKVNK